MSQFKAIIATLALLGGLAAGSLGLSEELLRPKQAFQVSAERKSVDQVALHWKIAEGYYLYRDKFRFSTNTAGIEIPTPELPPGKVKSDEYFGEVEIYRHALDVNLALKSTAQPPGPMKLTVSYQGCADIGVCYPPIKTTLSLNAPPPQEPDELPRRVSAPISLRDFGFQAAEDELLPATQAFRYFAKVKDANTLKVNWEIAEGYYLYREKFRFELAEAPDLRLGQLEIPHGTPEIDEAFGQVEIFHRGVEFDIPLIRKGPEAQTLTLIAHFQGCADRGVCYPPMQERLLLELPAADGTSNNPPQSDIPRSEQDEIAFALDHGTLGFNILVFFGYGLLLAFTPCVFPMVPILSGIIVGQGESITTLRAFILSLAYVLASAMTYTGFGVLAGLFGNSLNIQAWFQSPGIIIAFSTIFVLLACSMFGFYTLQMPAGLQTRLAGFSNRKQGGTLLAVISMGVVSSLIVGPCVAAPLAGALIYISQTGDAVFGGLALFSMGLGMGFPLLIIGTSAGKLLPKAGPWMDTTKAVFGVMLIAVSIWMLQRIVPPAAAMSMWAALLIICAVYLRAFDDLPHHASGWSRLWKGCGIILLTAGVLLLIGVASGSRDPLRPLNQLARAQSRTEQAPVEFTRIQSLRDLEGHLAQAGESGKWVMLDYYADWCISCKEMDYYTFSDPRVREALKRMVLVQADVTQNTLESQELLNRFDLFGPPAILFFEPGNQESRAYRIVGYKDPESFLEHLSQFLPNV